MTVTYEKLMRQPREVEQPTLPRSRKLRNAIAMQEIEGNPLTASEIARLEVLEASSLTPDEKIAEIHKWNFEELGVKKSL